MADKQKERRAQIEVAAFEVLEKVGYKKASMLQIAKQAKASNETLYAWYGNKQNLFSSLISANADVVERTLDQAISGETPPETALLEVGRLLLQFTTAEKAVIINRAAVADVQETGLLASSIGKNARQVMLRNLEKLMINLEASGEYHFGEGTRVAVGVYVDLLLGELQMQQALGAVPPLSLSDTEERAEHACRLFDRLYRAA